MRGVLDVTKTREYTYENSDWSFILILLCIDRTIRIFGGKGINNILEIGGFGIGALFFQIMLFSICFYIAEYVLVIVHEGGHFLFGKLCGYKFRSINIGNFMLISENGKCKFKKQNIVGTNGQCSMMLPKCDGYHYPYILYTLGGCIAEIIFSVICLLIYISMPQIKILSGIISIFVIIGFVGVIINGIPMQLNGIANDGLITISLAKDKEARHVFWLLSYISELNVNGTRICDMPKKYSNLSYGYR